MTREPTDRQIEAGKAAVERTGLHGTEGYIQEFVSEIWRAMWDANANAEPAP